MMDIAYALQIVLDLAKGNVINAIDAPEENARQEEAIRIVEDMAVNQFGDD